MADDRWIKDPNDVYDFAFRFGVKHPDSATPRLETNETITAIDVLDVATGLTQVGAEEVTESGKSVTFWVSGGTAGANYAVTCRITTTANRVYEITRTIYVRETKA